MAAGLRCATLIALLCWALAEGWPDWRFLVPGVAAGYLAARRFRHTASLRWSALPAFVGSFVAAACAGGYDVSKRALHPRLPLATGFVDVHTQLPAGPARLFLAAALSLLPGTLSVRLTPEHIRLHVLDRAYPVARETARLEARVAALFRVHIEHATQHG